MKKMISLLVSLCLLVSLAAVPVSAANETKVRFTDVSADEWYAKAVEYVQEAGLFSGKGDGTFDPDGSMNRAMMVQVLANATENYRSGVYSADIMPYSDVDDRAWYGHAIHWATDYQIASGKGNKTFAPLAAITREEAASMLFRYAQRTQNDTSHKGTALKDFSDGKSVSSWAVNAMDWAVENGILKGYPDGTLRPGRTITRAEAAMVFLNAKNVLQSRTAIFPMTETANKLGITADNYPRVDGSSTALLEDLFRAMHGIWNSVTPIASKTQGSYENLINRKADLILVLAPDEEILKKAERAGVKLDKYEIGIDALTFITPEDNKATNVTVDQLRKIYGDYSIKNWSALGGESKPLIPFCGTSGLDDDRQMQLERQILQEKPLNSQIEKNYASENWHNSMFYQEYDGVFLALDSYPCENFPYLSSTKVKALSINGIAPTEKNIANGTYPLTYSYYAVIRADEPKDSSARKLAEWLQTKEGQELIGNNGLVKLSN
ncbi:MAG: S-layer homology domain-containing protein [Acutalibacter sp.]|nr:S-layer homology domain-containing protein [Acutalibacter sp.]